MSFIISQKIHEFLFTKFQKICLGCKGIKQIKYRNIIVGIRTAVLIQFTQFQCTLCLCIIMGQLHNVSEVIADAGKKIIAIQNIQQLCLGILTLCTIAAVYADNITLVSEGNGAGNHGQSLDNRLSRTGQGISRFVGYKKQKIF